MKLFLLIILIFSIILSSGCSYLNGFGGKYEQLQEQYTALSDSLAALQNEVCEFKQSFQPDTSQKELVIIEPEESIDMTRQYRLPEIVFVLGDSLDIHEDQHFFERLDREFQLILQDRGQVMLWLKRSTRYFPHIESELVKREMPIDLKYVPVIESSLRTKAYSSSRAVGLWQFIRSTGRRYKLSKTWCIDEFKDWRKQTIAALKYLSDLTDKYNGNWYLALAAYNLGDSKLDRYMREQKEDGYFDLHLPSETERYVFRLMAVKILMENYPDYGFELTEEDFYPYQEVETVEFRLTSSISTYKVYQAMDMSAWSFYQLNAHIVEDQLSGGNYYVYVPPDLLNTFKENFTQVKGVKITD